MGGGKGRRGGEGRGRSRGRSRGRRGGGEGGEERGIRGIRGEETHDDDAMNTFKPNNRHISLLQATSFAF